MKFSIITVTYNDLDNLKVTYCSVKNQTFTDYEYLVVDGGSTDGTVDYLEYIKNNDSRVRYVSEKDQGIYDAMNKGVKLSAGEYILFLGAADTFYSYDILDIVCNYLSYGWDAIYGKCEYSSGAKKGELIGHKLTHLNILLDKWIAHQSVFVKRDLLINYPFDLKYKTYSDQDFMIKIQTLKYKLKYFDKIFCYYDGLGFSASKENEEEKRLEKMNMLKTYYPFLYLLRLCGHVIKGYFGW